MDIKDRFQAQAKDNKEFRREIEIPEIPLEDGSPLVLYSKPVTLRDERVISQMAMQVQGATSKGGQVDNAEMILQTLIYKLEDENGDKVFSHLDRDMLQSQCGDMIRRIYLEISARPTQEEVTKNLKETKTSEGS